MASFCRMSSCIYGTAAVPPPTRRGGVPLRQKTVSHVAAEDKLVQKKPQSWPEAPKGYAPLPPTSFAPALQDILLQRGVELKSDTEGTLRASPKSPTVSVTAEASPAPTSTVKLLEKLAESPELWRGARKNQLQENSVHKQPRTPPDEDTLTTAWAARDEVDRRKVEVADESTGNSRPHGKSLLKSRDHLTRRRSSGSGSGLASRRLPVVPRPASKDSTTVSPLRRRRSSNVSSMGTILEDMIKRKVVIKEADMPEDMQKVAIQFAQQALEDFDVEKDIAGFMKKEFDRLFSPTWHCIVGHNFGSFVTYEKDCFIYFYSGQIAVMLFKSG